MIVFDTNVGSELMKAEPDESVVRWYDAQRSKGLCTTAVTVAEIRYGIELLPSGRRKALMAAVADEVFAEYADTILSFDASAAALYPQVVIGRRRSGLPIGQSDAQIAAICRAVDATLVTRNTKDFLETGVPLVNPWE
ncbi:type II toxin-antitoxin system VapC family toxin [Kribbella sindirgiensis]|uniref:Ribonuclease VapC n=1 Tax=Kribbella sindirgiensis TaxID=1124744 RepID=A0A4R0IFC1_9ACTN|nr:type II toxin-antitoxin system VapC family toxin [Kribbella sindirgiensis]TCC31199.1 type II toxin-antitoxin system VapC family toxin [Kribbella sindirgiensis]